MKNLVLHSSKYGILCAGGGGISISVRIHVTIFLPSEVCETWFCPHTVITPHNTMCIHALTHTHTHTHTQKGQGITVFCSPVNGFQNQSCMPYHSTHFYDKYTIIADLLL
jgi:hypothetical protein